MSTIQIVGTFAGSAIGSLFGPMGAIQGAAIGYSLGGAVEQQYFAKGVTVSGPRLGDTTVQISSYGKPINKIYGTMRVAGNVIWMQPIKETASTSHSGGKGGGGAKQNTTTYSYSATLAIAICEGPIDGIIQVWADSELLTSEKLGASNSNYNIYLGTNDQLADPIMESYDGMGNVPAYRGIAYVLIKDFPLENYGNRIPNFTFEVKRTVRQSPSLEESITAINLIPGAGEFVYDTTIQSRVNTITNVSSAPVNVHNSSNMADLSYALDQLQGTLPNLEWVGLVVTWFATSTDAGECEIIPKVEAKGDITTSPDAWAVAGWTRETAEQVLQFEDGKPTYGGTPSDNTVIRAAEALKARGYNVMFYPMMFVDTITPLPKPWRGRITPANATDADNLFTKTNGYNDFINHYLNLSIGGVALKDHIDAFVIGTEYVGMTGATFATGVYPAVTGFKNVAATAKSILPGSVKTVYAADWSEYHHTEGGWFNMDPLWSDPNLDIVGIDAYFPLTPDLPQSQITYQKIYDGWIKDEGYDYYWNDDRTIRTNFTGLVYAWKAVEYWWKHTHTNPDSSTTDWAAKMKPIWFTEFGFPSVDGCANQPNVFVDPTSSESFYPRGSKQRIDFAAQRQALQATIDRWDDITAETGNSELVAQKFIWTWDARPYPAYPNLLSVWADGILWKTGHWINGKVGLSGLGVIIANLLQEIGVSNYDVSSLTDTIDGFVITQVTTVRQAIDTFTIPYFFDVVESDGLLKFIKRGQTSIADIPQDKLLPPTGSNSIRSTAKMSRAQELDLPRLITASYFNAQKSYESNTQIAQRQTTNAINQVNYNWPLAMPDQTAQDIVQKLLYSAWVARTSYEFSLPPEYAYLEPADVITITVEGIDRVVRITDSTLQPNGATQIKAVVEDVSVYDFYLPPGDGGSSQELPPVIPVTQMLLLDLPAFPHDNPSDSFITLAAAPLGPDWKGAVAYRSDDGGEAGGNSYNLLTSLPNQSGMGIATSILASGNTYTWDNANTVDVVLMAGELSSTNELAVLNGSNVCVIGNEVLQFRDATLIGTQKYRLSTLLRGRLGTEDQVTTHTSNELFILLDNSLTRLPAALSTIGLLKYYKCVSVGDTLGNTEEQSFTYAARQLKPYSPVQITGTRDDDGNFTISWIRRTRIGGELRDGVDVPLNEQNEAYEVDIMDGSDVVRTITGLSSPTASYSASDQITDFGSVQSAITVKVYQLSAAVGRGIAGETIV